MSTSDRDIKSFDQRLGDQVRNKWDNYERIRIDLAQARSMHRYLVAGEFIAVEQTSSGTVSADIILELENRDIIKLNRGRIIETVFRQFFITNTAQSGQWIDIIIGRNFKTYKDGQGTITGQARQILNVTHVNPNTNVTAAAHACNSAIIKADVYNTQVAWVDFGVAAVQNNCYPLDPGEWVKADIPNTDQINVNFEVGGEIVYVLYQS